MTPTARGPSAGRPNAQESFLPGSQPASIVRWTLFHFRGHRVAGTLGPQCLDSLVIVDDGRKAAGLDLGRKLSWAFGLPALGPRAVGVTHVPIPSFGQDHPLCGR